MGKWTILRNGNALTGGGTGGGTGGSGSSVPNVQAVTCSGFMNAVSGGITLTVGVTPPATIGSFIGCHLYLEIPDQSSNAAQVVGSTAVAGTAAVTGPWNVIDLGEFVYDASQQPWTITGPGSPGIDPTLNVACRLYAVSYSNADVNTLVQANQTGPSPNVGFTLVSLASGTPTSGTSVTQTSGSISALVLAADNSTGKLKTPVLVVVSSIPVNIANWCYQLVVTYGTADPTQFGNQHVVTPILSNAGEILAPADGITVPHSFVIDTPTTPTAATIWLQSGLMNGGVFQANNIVPGITPSWPITVGSSTGVLDLSQAAQGSFDGVTLQTTLGVFQVGVIGQANIGAAQVGTAQIQNLAVTNSLLASGIDAGKVNTGTLTVGGTGQPFIQVNSPGGSQIGWIGSTTIGGTAFQGGWFQQLRIGGASTSTAPLTCDSSGNLTIAWPKGSGGYGSASTSLSIANGALQAIQYNIGGTTIQDTYLDGSGLNVVQAGSPGGSVSITATSINVASGVQVSSLTATQLYVPLTIQTAQVTANVVQAGVVNFTGSTATSASAGSASALPGPPAGYLIIEINGVNYKLPFFS